MMNAKDTRKLSNDWNVYVKNKYELEIWCNTCLNDEITKCATEGRYLLNFDIRRVPGNCSNVTKIKILKDYLSENGYTLKKFIENDENNYFYQIIW